jgi:hypothetical protein
LALGALEELNVRSESDSEEDASSDDTEHDG